MPDEEMRLVGIFQDKISSGLKSSIDKIKAFTKEGEKAGTDGARSVNGMRRPSPSFAIGLKLDGSWR
jgi:hypothetical protein